MIPFTSTQLPPLDMRPVNGEASQRYKAPGNKIGWLHSINDKPGASFDIVIRDGLGRVMYEKKNCKTDTDKFGEYVGYDTKIGEEIEVSLENVKGADSIQLFLN